MAKAAIRHDGPSLCTTWSADGMKCFSGGADKSIQMLDLPSGQSIPMPNAHEGAVSCLRWVTSPSFSALVSGSWDKTLKYWDLRSPTAMATVQLPERCYAMDFANDLLVVGTAERHLLMYSMSSGNPAQPVKSIASPLKWQTRTVSCFPNGSGFAVGSIEGRVGIQYVNAIKAEE